MKNMLYRKRLRCLLARIEKGANEPADKMDVHQVGVLAFSKKII